MSEISDMIQRLCPDGVEYRKLGEVCLMQRGTSLTKKNSNEGIYPVISGGREPAFYCDTYNREGETITVAGSGAGAGYLQFWNEPIFVCDAFSIKGTSLLDNKYLYYCLTNMQEAIYATKKGGGVPHVHISSIEDFEIPVPPLEVQRKIVEVLDNFSELTAELTAELEARKKQYEYYRDNLLNFSKIAPPNSVKWMKLGEIGDVKMCKRVMKHQTNTEYGIPFYKIGTFGKTADAFISQELFNELKNSYSYPKYGDILISASGTIGRTVVYNGEDAYYQDSNIVWIDNDESIALNSYLKIIYQVIEWKVEGGTIKRLYNDNIKNTVIPIPPLSEQERIVSILDRFEALTTDLTAGLPAEIKARQQQYEYYREQLLTFKRAN